MPVENSNSPPREGPVADYEPWSEGRAAGIIAEHSGKEGATLPILHAIQAAFGYIPDGAIPAVASALNLSRAEVYGIVSFYHEFRRHPPGRHILHVCRAEACQARGADSFTSQLRDRLGVEWHGTTADGAVTLEPVFCLGLCAIGPSALLDGQPLGRLDAEKVEAALE
ncbi:MAG: formate dehydrogenase subunit gamma, partial [Acetobacteraceae bacterium]|nr:formate dehydrogenase subunit gamma [Acetobacteraceae bacterium]